MIHKRIRFGFWLSTVSIVVAGLIIWIMAASASSVDTQNAQATSRQIALTCTTDTATRFHIHPQLRIVIRGKEQVIPEGIGLKQNCMNAIHTHSSDGVIHIESPIKKDFTLSDLFAVWGKPFTRDQVLDAKVSANNQIEVTVNGAKVNSLDQTIMKDEDKILIEVK